MSTLMVLSLMFAITQTDTQNLNVPLNAMFVPISNVNRTAASYADGHSHPIDELDIEKVRYQPENSLDHEIFQTSVWPVDDLKEMTRRLKGHENMDGLKRAEFFNRCIRGHYAFNTSHKTDSVFSRDHGFIFVDNQKTATITMRKKLQKVLNAFWINNGGFDDMNIQECAIQRNSRIRRTSTACITASQAKGLFKFGFTRDPVAKFESGVRQARQRLSHMKSSNDGIISKFDLTADEMLDAQLAMEPGEWFDEHLMPTTWVFSGIHADGEPIELDFLGKLENLKADWSYVVTKGMKNISHTQIKELMILGHENTKTDTTVLSSEGIRRMCASELYRHEWTCSGYELPDACKR